MSFLVLTRPRGTKITLGKNQKLIIHQQASNRFVPRSTGFYAENHSPSSWQDLQDLPPRRTRRKRMYSSHLVERMVQRKKSRRLMMKKMMTLLLLPNHTRRRGRRQQRATGSGAVGRLCDSWSITGCYQGRWNQRHTGGRYRNRWTRRV